MLSARAFRCLLLAVGPVLCWSSPAAGQVGTNLDLVNPNLASRDDLSGLPHLDAAAVDQIIEQRPFLDMLSLHALLEDELSSEEEMFELYSRIFIPVNLNTAPEEEILLIPGAGPRMAHEFDEYRPYRAIAQFRREIGKYVNDDELARLEQYVFVPIDLNTASEEAILSIPGVGNRMLHEFLEYRPYRAMAQFRREIGKYVDDDELARLERYVVINP